ncbi:2-amino-4-hydroxy-6-hydroxymethyldihydropteridine pyrophosphokinase [Acinetobacter sp. NCu2D-2]|uniref:2-amino-4-hydroxy-6- hydroxymethyldihydropteridine diphosphokinase n=1 Tax=Acinetobacter sp. NCu2D-2 TaxID=1608473 RepID=UPI0007CDC9CF|nr:2-amino-4-hydroxy-6-hydroxymethyldihydropteridine diphosphokinase [Acinetobacter sp. NCu2D-2]ANF81901.1 2-amino-4-hydroxy-6-hydroxymethyldihydropteridine pyrophosphokinase [Acinetobacter sp. NCu2D-2]
MNATETIFALALASNCHPQQHFQAAQQRIGTWGNVQFSPIYVIPCRDGIGADYWNSACLLKSPMTVEEVILALKQMEADSGRIRPSHQISLDVDLIAWGQDLSHMQFNQKKLPLALDVKIPMYDLWPNTCFEYVAHQFPVVECS